MLHSLLDLYRESFRSVKRIPDASYPIGTIVCVKLDMDNREHPFRSMLLNSAREEEEAKFDTMYIRARVLRGPDESENHSYTVECIDSGQEYEVKERDMRTVPRSQLLKFQLGIKISLANAKLVSQDESLVKDFVMENQIYVAHFIDRYLQNHLNRLVDLQSIQSIQCADADIDLFSCFQGMTTEDSGPLSFTDSSTAKFIV